MICELAFEVLNSFDVSLLSQLYADIDDVDLFILGLAEKPQRGALVGPTFACIIGKQFQKVISHFKY